MNWSPARRLPRPALALVSALVIALGFAFSSQAGAQPAEAEINVADLREGGYVIFFRHITSTVGSDQAMVDLLDCSTQRNVSSEGVQDALAIGRGFRRHAVPIGDIYTSEFCRAEETARIAFGRINPTPQLNLCCSDPRPYTNEERLNFMVQLSAVAPQPGTNTVIVAHGVGINSDLAMGEAGIYRVENGMLVRVARVLPNEWHGGIFRPGGIQPQPVPPGSPFPEAVAPEPDEPEPLPEE